MAIKVTDLTGQKFGALRVLGQEGRAGKLITWRFLCNCGNEVVRTRSSVQASPNPSCGCLSKIKAAEHCAQLSKQKLLDLTGQVFGRLTVQASAGQKGGRTQWRCKCQCGEETVAATHNLRKGSTRSCGCLLIDTLTSHGQAGRGRKARAWGIWGQMVQRCTNPKNAAYENYGGRGVSIHPEWLKFENFFRDMGDAPAGLTLERKDNDKGYSPENCVWASRSAQARNRRRGLKASIGGKERPLAECAEALGLPYSKVYWQVQKLGSAQAAVDHLAGVAHG